MRSLTDFGAFVDLGGVDGLLHVSDMSYARGIKPADVVTVGEAIEVKILKINRETHKIALGLKQLAPDPWIGSQREISGRARASKARSRAWPISARLSNWNRDRRADPRF